MEIFTAAGLVALLQVIVIDLVLAGDNAVVIGLAAAGLPTEQRKKVILVGIIAATVLRVALASVTVQLLEIIGLLLAGGILLLWVCWKMWREIREQQAANAAGESGAAADMPKKTFMQAAIQIVVADVSMSLDNVLAVAGAAREHPTILVVGLVLSIAMMGVAAGFIARLLNRYHWIAYIGLAIILYVALDMIYRGSVEVWPHVAPAVAAMV
ncbi:TerC family protein [Ensifer sp. 2YAB10]|uniref:TerC family protein n=1 Tax=unclassified Ensifer TaxID=2633371 RepID=UPI003F8FD3F3